MTKLYKVTYEWVVKVEEGETYQELDNGGDIVSIPEDVAVCKVVESWVGNYTQDVTTTSVLSKEIN